MVKAHPSAVVFIGRTFFIDLNHARGREMPPPSVKLVIPALAGIVAVRAKAQPPGVVLIGRIFFIEDQA